MQTLTFQNTTLTPVVQKDGQIWLSSSDLAKALDYAQSNAVTKLYNENADEFTSCMTMVIETMTNGINNSQRKIKTRIFSLRGCHLIAMFARTTVAKEFRKWVLDILDKEVGAPVQTLTEAQLQKIQQGVKRCEKAGYSHQRVYSELHAKWGVSSYKDVKPADFCNVMYFLDNLAHPVPRVNRFEPATARAVSQAMEYLHGLHAEIRRLGGTAPKLAIDEQALAQAVLTRMIQGKRLMVSLDYATNTLKPHLVDEQSYIIRENQIADIIADPAGISKEQLPEIMKAVLKRTGIEV